MPGVPDPANKRHLPMQGGSPDVQGLLLPSEGSHIVPNMPRANAWCTYKEQSGRAGKIQRAPAKRPRTYPKIEKQALLSYSENAFRSYMLPFSFFYTLQHLYRLLMQLPMHSTNHGIHTSYS